MISASVRGAGLAARLAGKAAAVAETRLSARSAGPRRWRRAGWLWPLFAKG